jgi:hypothetical protein
MISSLSESLPEDRLHEVGVDRADGVDGEVAISAYLPNIFGGRQDLAGFVPH